MTTFLLLRFLLKKKNGFKITLKYKYLFLVLIAMLVSFSATPQVSADFTTITSTTGCGSLVVEFKDLSIGNPTTWLWDFGNGNTSTLKNPVATYNSPGFYDVTLTVANTISNDTKVSISIIEVFENPVAALQLNLLSNECIPLNTSFTDLSSSSSAIIEWQWDFGDGGSSNLQNPDYIYSNPGLYSVSLSVTDNNGCQNLVTEMDLILVNESPEADFSSNNYFSCDSIHEVDFINNSINSSVFMWDFGDGTISTIFDPSHEFSTGFYTVTLYAIEGNCIDTLVLTDYIEVLGAKQPDFTLSSNSGCEGLNVAFSDQISSNATSWLWDFGDGSTSILQNPIHFFDSAGVFDIKLTTNVNGHCILSTVRLSELEVFSNPHITFSSDTNIGCSIPLDVAFYDSTVGAISWSWDFGDGSFSNLENPLKTYVNSGFFDVSLLVENSNGCVSSVLYSDYVRIDESPVIGLSASPLISCSGESVSFIDLSTVGVNDWQWDFGDGNISDDQNPIHQYSMPGTYDVSLIGGVNMCKDTILISDYITIVEPAASFKENYNCEHPLKVEFVNLSVGADSVFWDFGDGNSSTLFNPVYTFSNLGVHLVSLSVTNNVTGCKHILSKEIELTQPVANFDYIIDSNNGHKDSSSCVPDRMYIDNQSLDWVFMTTIWGDGGVHHGPSHIYTNSGVFDVTLIVSDIHDCKDTMTIENMITMHDINVDFTVDNIMGCDSFLVDFDVISNSSLSLLEWDFGDGTVSNNQQHIYYNEGIYDVLLFAESINGCRDTVTKIDYINFQKPIANFSAVTNNFCKGDQVFFSNLSVGNGLDYLWSFGDGISSNLMNPTHEYILSGNYDVSLLVADSFGCIDSFKVSDYIKIFSPSADFSSSTLNSNCPPLISNFINLSSSDAVYFQWNFGDGSYSLIENPSHLYSTSGSFDVSLIVEDSLGCKDTLLKTDYLNMLGVMPNGFFEVSNTSICIDDTILFYPNISNANDFFWDFGNGEFSNDSVAFAIYNDSGSFIPTLIVENATGCQLTINSEDTIRVAEIIVDAGLDLEICMGSSVDLSAFGNGFLFEWMPLIGLNNTSIQNPQASPISSGTYYVTNSDGFCSAIDSVYIKVYNDVPNATFNTTSHCEGDSTYFIANSGLNTNNNSYLWSFGDNGIEVASVLNVGDNNITLVVKNLNNSCVDTVEKNVQIFDNPVADFLNTEVCFGDTVSFTDNFSSNVTSWIYNFGDSIGFSTDNNPIYIYQNHGDFNVKLNVISDMGCEDSILKKLVVNKLPIPAFSSNAQQICDGDTVQFVNLSSSSSINSLWGFGDSMFSHLTNPSHIFISNGGYDISLLIIDSMGCSNSIKLSNYIQVLSPKADFTSSGNSQNCSPVDIDFMNSSSIDANSFYWDFGDGSFSLAVHPSHLFLDSGFYNVSLIVENLFGCKDTVKKGIEVFASPIADFILSDICLGDSLFITDNSYADVSAVWNYDFGDGFGFSCDPSPKYLFSDPGLYNVLLTITSEMGCEDTLSKDLIVHDIPKVNFSVENRCEDKGNIFIDSSFVLNSEISSIQFNFNDGSISSDSIALHVFNGFGFFDVELTAFSMGGCSGTKTKTVEVFPKPIVDFSSSQFCEKEKTIFNNYSYVHDGEIVSYNWTFGLDGASNDKNTAYIFSSHGIFNVGLLVNSDKGCENILNKEIKINRRPGVDFKIPTDVCLGEEFDIFYVSDANEDIVSWNYNFGDGSFSKNRNPSHIYNYISNFDVGLEVLSSHGCRNDTVMLNVIKAHDFPIADFKVDKLFASEISSEISFYNGSVGATKYLWDFDNGEYTYEENPIFRFNNPRSYDVSLTATNDFGCSSNMIKTIQINPEFTFYIPDAFTPDNDGINDVFIAKGKRISSFFMQVFNRWGEVVFESSKIDFGWNGKNSSGKMLSNGVYLYKIQVYDLNQRLRVYNGEVKLLR